MEWANAILEYGTNIILIMVLAYAVLCLWKQNIADRDRHNQETKEREDKYINTIDNFSTSLDNFSNTLTSIDNRMHNLETSVDKIEEEIEELKK